MENEYYLRFEAALINIGIKKGAIDSLDGQTHVKDVLKSSSQLVQVLRDMSIPLERYIANYSEIASPKDWWGKLSEEGIRRLTEAGEFVGARERAQMLIEAGGKNGSLASLYTHLTIEDLFNICAYESEQRRAVEAVA